jgi:hypothetical protein
MRHWDCKRPVHLRLSVDRCIRCRKWWLKPLVETDVDDQTVRAALKLVRRRRLRRLHGGEPPPGVRRDAGRPRMYGPAVRRGRFRRISEWRSCINVSGLWLERGAPGHRGYQRACVPIMRQASTGPFGPPGFACAGKPVLHLVSSSRRPRHVRVWWQVLALPSSSSLVRVVAAHAGRSEGTDVFTTSKLRCLLRTAQVMRASL